MSGGRKGAYRVLVGKPEAKNRLEDIEVYVNIVLKLLFRKLNETAWTKFIWLRTGASGEVL
jgi:hypothetical protein